ncbi:MAG TPA: hypothetical protein DIC52_09715 [Candidatus Latescibacteria bacterium]|nr:hypothetical protein [Candidatus Latescibacterota bacterium]
MDDRRQQITDFARDGFLVLPDVLTSHQVDSWNIAIEEHRRRYSRLWMERGEGGRSQSVHVLLSCPTLDEGITHPEVLPLVTELMGEDIVCEEHSVMFRAPIDEEPPATNWHRDMGHEPNHPLGIYGLSVVYYLTNVDESTHCFSVVPEASVVKRSDDLPVCDGGSGRDLLGAAGTAVLFNGGSCHAGRLRKTTRERRTVHVYYGHASQPPLSEHTIFPRRLLDHPEADKRRLFRRPNQITCAVHNLDGD